MPSATSDTKDRLAVATVPARAKCDTDVVKVLVVEDEIRLSAALKRGLEAEGFTVDVAGTGSDGLWLATEQPYDVIVLDIMLPGINGLKICQTLRAKEIWTPVLMLTAKDGELDEAEALEIGADDFLSKPFSYTVLVARLRALIRRGAAARPIQDSPLGLCCPRGAESECLRCPAGLLVVSAFAKYCRNGGRCFAAGLLAWQIVGVRSLSACGPLRWPLSLQQACRCHPR
jgi:CheY-like chemotaxis protein